METESMTLTDQGITLSNGYFCASCSQWVPYGFTHNCFGSYQMPTYSYIDNNRLAELMEDERKLKEIKDILEGG